MKASQKSLTNLFSLSAFITAIFFTVNFLFTIRFETNDDAAMLLISSGKYTGKIDNHLVFINFILGSFLNILYSITNKIEWYTVLIIGLNIISVATIIKNILESKFNKLLKVVLVIFLVAIFCQFSILMQFTKTSALLIITGFTGVLIGKRYILSATLIILATLLRFEMAAFMLLILSPTLILSSTSFKSTLTSKPIKVFAITILIAFTLKGSDKLYYVLDNDWNQFVEYNLARGKINDNPYLQTTKTGLPEGISHGELKLFLYSTIDPNIMSQDKLDALNISLEGVSISDKWAKGSSIFKEYKLFLISLIVISTILILNNYKSGLRVIISCLAFGSLLIFISLGATIKSRLILPGIFGIIICFILASKASFKTITSIGLSLVLIWLSTHLFSNLHDISIESKSRRELFHKQLNLINGYLSKSGKNLVPYGPSFHMEYENPFHVSENFPTKRLTFAGWATSSPHNNGMFNSYKDFTSNYSLLTFSVAAEETQELVKESLLKNYNLNVSPQLVLFESDLGIIEFPIKNN